MEEFDGGARLPWDKIREAIDDCDYYILLVAGRCGSQDLSDPAGLSYTEKEYNLAQQLGKEIIVFMLSDKAMAGLPADRLESLRRNKEKLAASEAGSGPNTPRSSPARKSSKKAS